MRSGFAVVVLSMSLLPLESVAAEKSWESISKKSNQICQSGCKNKLHQVLAPFVANCDRKKTKFKKLFCSGLNERLKAQHQTKDYIKTFAATGQGPLKVKFKARPKPVMEIQVRGCLTCGEPLLAREGGDISRGRFFVFKMPKAIKIRRRGKVLYDLGNIDVTAIRVPLPKKTTRKKFLKEILPHLRLDIVFRPVAGVTMIGQRIKYGVISFQLTGYRAYHKCEGKVYGISPKMKAPYLVDRNDLSCPQNQPKVAVVVPKLPSNIPQKKLKALITPLKADLMSCYERYGTAGDVPTEIVISPTGKVKFVKVVGKLAGTPSGKCVERLVKNITFPKFSGRDARFQMPFSLKR